MNPSSLHPSYSYEYSATIVDRFLDSYSRVLIFVSKKLRMDPRDLRKYLIKLFQSNQPRWRITRDTLKQIEKYDMYTDMAKLSREDFIKYYTCVKSLVEDDWMDGKIR